MGNANKAKTWFPHFKLGYTLTGAPAPVEHWPIASGVTVVAGAPVLLDDGEIVLATATSGTLYGIANGNGEAGDTIPVLVGDRNTVFVGRSNAKTENITAFPAEADIVAVSDEWRVNIGASVEGVLQVVSLVQDDDDEDNTVPGRVYFKIKRSQWDQLVAAK